MDEEREAKGSPMDIGPIPTYRPTRPNEDHLVGYEEDVTLEEREWMRSE